MEKYSKKTTYIIWIIVFCVSVAAGFLVLANMLSFARDEKVTNDLHMYWKEVDCEVTEVNHGLLFLELGIYNSEYNMNKSFHLFGKEIQEYDMLQAGDTLSCILYSWILEDTEEVIDRTLLLYSVY